MNHPNEYVYLSFFWRVTIQILCNTDNLLLIVCVMLLLAVLAVNSLSEFMRIQNVIHAYLHFIYILQMYKIYWALETIWTNSLITIKSISALIFSQKSGAIVCAKRKLFTHTHAHAVFVASIRIHMRPYIVVRRTTKGL